MNNKNFIIAIIILIITMVGVHVLISMRGEYEVVEKGFYKLPMQIGEWKAESFDFSERVYDVLNAQENLARNYYNEAGDKIGLYIGYYSTKRGGHPEHIPRGCYTGAGFGVVSENDLVITSESGKHTVTVDNFYARKGDIGEQVLYWLHNYRGVDMNTGLKQNIEKMKNKLFNRRNDGAFIRINTSFTLGSDPNEGGQTPIDSRKKVLQQQKAFVAKLLDLLPDCWPVEEIR